MSVDCMPGIFDIHLLTPASLATRLLLLFCLASLGSPADAQQRDASLQVIEGGRLVVELIQALGSRQGPPRDPGCKNRHADVCIENLAPASTQVILESRESLPKRELVILPGGKECTLQVPAGVWTYELRLAGTFQAIRKGDLRIEGCQDVLMQIK